MYSVHFGSTDAALSVTASEPIDLPTSMEWDKPKKNQIYISNHYIGGQHCDETGRGRYTEVR